MSNPQLLETNKKALKKILINSSELCSYSAYYNPKRFYPYNLYEDLE